VQIPLFALRAQIGSAIDIIVQTSRLRDGSRCVTHVTDVVGYDMERGYQLQDLFTRHYLGRRTDGSMASELRPTGAFPRAAEMIQALGMDLPGSMYHAAHERERGR
jgi:pilus assembly protein CpaF